MKTPLVVLGWALTLAAAFSAGRAIEGGAEPPDDAPPAKSEREVALDRRVVELTRQLKEEQSRAARAQPTRERARATDASEFTVDSGIDAPPPPASLTVDTTAPFTVEGVTSAPELSKRLMTYVEAQYARGPEGYPAIMDALSAIMRNRDTMKELFQDESSASKELYPWIKMLVRRENETVGLTEYVFRTMAEKPDSFADLPNDDLLELFTEGMAFLLPGVVPEERMAIFRTYAKKILDTPQGQQSKAVQGIRSDLERLLDRMWREPITPEDALAKLADASINAKEAGRLVRALSPEMRAKLDVTELVSRLLQRGDHDSVQLLAAPPFDRIERNRLDRALMNAVALGTINRSGTFVVYLHNTGRRAWADARPLVDSALGLGAKGEALVFSALDETHLRGSLKPDAAWVADVLSRHTVPADLTARLKQTYGIQ